VDIATLDDANVYWRDTTGTPRYWYIDKEENKFGIFPYPKNSTEAADGIHIKYVGKHTKMTRYYTTGTVTMTNASTAVTGASTAFTGNVLATDQIGLGKLLDPTYATGFPSTFYTVSSVTNNTALVLSSAFAEATSAGASYIASSTSSIVYDELNRAVLNYVLALAKFKDKDPDMGMFYENRAEKIMRMETERIVNLETSNTTMVPMGTLPGTGFRMKDYAY